MFNNWERQAAECLTNAEHMREVRQKIDLEHQERLRRREQERAEAEVRRETRLRQLPKPTPPVFNKYRARTYDRPWAQITHVTKTPSFTSGYMGGSRTGHLTNKSSVSRLPVITHRAQTMKQDLAATGRTQQRVPATVSQHSEDLPPSCLKHRFVNEKIRTYKLPSSRDFYTPRRPQSRRPKEAPRQQTQKEKPKTKPLVNRQALSPIPVGQDRICGLDNFAVPLPLSSPDWTPIDWELMASLHCRSPSPVDESDLQLISDPFQEILDECSMRGDTGIGESSSSRLTGTNCSQSLLDNNLLLGLEPTPPPTSSNQSRTLENSLNNYQSGSLSNQIHPLDFVSYESEGEDDPLPLRTSDLVELQPSVRLEARVLGEMGRASFSGGYSPVPPIIQASTISSPASAEESIQMDGLTSPTAREYQIQELYNMNVSPRRVSWVCPLTMHNSTIPENRPQTSPTERNPTLAIGQLSQDCNRLEEQEEVGGAVSTNDSVGTASSEIRATGLLDHLALALMALQDVRREVVQIHLDHTQERSGGAALETKPPADPETLRRITERLLEEESDEEEGELCRICQCWGGTPQNPLLTPCQCTGSLQYVHHDCLKRWIQAKVQSGAELTAVKTCELCKTGLNLDLENFDLEECYRHHQTQVEQANPMHLLQLLQQRLWDLVHVVETRSYTSFNVAAAIYLLHRAAGSARSQQMMAFTQTESSGGRHQGVTPEESPDP